MKKFIHIALIAGFALGLGACGSSGGGGADGGNNSAHNLPTYAEAEHKADLENLNSTEKGLERFGLKFKTGFDYNNGASTTTYSWDSSFLQAYFSSRPTATQKDMIPAWENYVRIANGYTQKYSGAFNLKKSDGSVEAKQLLETVKQEIEAKVSVANQTITKLKSL